MYGPVWLSPEESKALIEKKKAEKLKEKENHGPDR